MYYIYKYNWVCAPVSFECRNFFTTPSHSTGGAAFVHSFSNTAVVLYEFITIALFCIHNDFENLFYATKWHTDPTCLHTHPVTLCRTFLPHFFHILQYCRSLAPHSKHVLELFSFHFFLKFYYFYIWNVVVCLFVVVAAFFASAIDLSNLY